MSEIKNKIDLRAAFLKTQQTYEEAVEKAKKEAGRPNIDRYRINKDGEYNIRILPLAPIIDEEGNVKEPDRSGYEYPIHQLFIKIKVPKAAKNGKTKETSVTIPIIKTTDAGVGYSVDLIDKYVEIARSYGDDKINEQLAKTSFYGGLKWAYQHAMYILDIDDKRKGPKLFQCSHTLYRNIEVAKLAVWGKLKGKQGFENMGCPVSSFSAWPITINRTTGANNKTESNVNIVPIEADLDNLEEKDLETLFDMPRLPELLYRYTRYQLEATLVFLEQMDKELDIDVLAQPDFQEAADKLKGELPADDTSHFDLSKEGGDSKGGNAEITIESLWNENDALEAEGFEQNSRESKELRDKINQFIQDNDIDVRVSHNKSNADILNDIEDFLASDKGQKKPSVKDTDMKDPKPSRQQAADDNGDDDEPKPSPRRRQPEPEDDNEPEPRPRRRQPEPDEDDEPEPEPQPRRRRQPEPDPEPEPETEQDDSRDMEDEPQPRRRRR